MAEKQIAPFGSWKTPITADLIVSGTIGLGEISVNGDDLYWIEARPAEAGRNVLVRRTGDGQITDITPASLNTRTRVNEYGGGAYLVTDEAIYFSNFADNLLYKQTGDSLSQPLTRDSQMRYTDFVLDSARHRLIAVREDHTLSDTDCTNTIVSIDLATGENTVLVEGCDFYSSPRLSPDGKQLCWMEWNHPNLPWDGTELWTADLNPDGTFAKWGCVAGGKSDSIFQPEWSPAGVLHFVSDQTGWWNLYRIVNGKTEPLYEMEAEFGYPHWVFRLSLYDFVSANEIICTYNVQGNWQLGRLNTTTRTLSPIETAYTDIRSLRVGKSQALFIGGSPTQMDAVVSLNLATGDTQVLRRSSELAIDEAYLSIAQAIEFPTENKQTAYAFYYPPKNKDYEAPADERPPLICISHGGPTAATSSTLRLTTQFWTSRGFGVVDVNYGGSTGYGRKYRERLNGNWGIVDVNDCVNAARFLVEQGKADGDRLIIRGGSAGGYTTLAALTFKDFFKAGASYFGISDLEALEQDCHKFEARYNASLIGPHPQAKELYKARSPIHHTERLSCPIILFQGLDDKIVPPNQAEMMFVALQQKQIPVAYITLEGEGHGFRKAENIKRTLNAELYFYSRVFGFAVDVQLDDDLLKGFHNFPPS
ncbi:MAG: prolyl oligopeptidase family serine peptidase [Acidobacteriota bacterium]